MAALLRYRGPHSFAQIAKDFEVGVSLSALADIFIPLGAIGFTVATRSRANLCLISLVVTLLDSSDSGAVPFTILLCHGLYCRRVLNSMLALLDV